MTARSSKSRLVPALLVFSLLVPASVAFAQEDSAAAADSPMRPGAWAIQFGIGDNFDLESFTGGALAIKRHSSANCAWRAGVSLFAGDSDGEQLLEYPDSTVVQEFDVDRQSIGIELDWLRYFGASSTVRPYFGFGPRASWSHDTRTALGLKRETDGWALGAGGVFGAEYRATSAIGIHAEYRYGLNYASQTQETVNELGITPTERIETKSWNLSSAGVRFGLSAYF